MSAAAITTISWYMRSCRGGWWVVGGGGLRWRQLKTLFAALSVFLPNAQYMRPLSAFQPMRKQTGIK